MDEQVNRVGEIRTSQLLWNYGPGALLDLPNMSAVTMGLDVDVAEDVDGWSRAHSAVIEEPRLLQAVRKRLGDQVDSLLMPPIRHNDDWYKKDRSLPVGIPVEPFPRWLRCPRCSRLAHYSDPAFRLWPDWKQPERTRFYHKDCARSTQTALIPARLVLACRAGHLDDFPWHWYVHNGPSDCAGELQLFEVGAAIETSNLMLSCTGCERKRPLATVLSGDGNGFLPACRGRHPHLGTFEGCSEEPRVLNLGASNIWFPVALSALDVPLAGALPDEPVSLNEIKWPEWEALTAPEPAPWPAFKSRITDSPKGYTKNINQVVLLDRLREVNALIGFTRVDPPDEGSGLAGANHLVRVSRTPPTWVPAGEVHGEGIFIQFDEGRIQHWERLVGVQQRYANLEQGHHHWRQARNLAPGVGMPDMRYVMMHTLSHLLIREFAFTCGYNAASLKERIYASSDDDQPMAGILIYTAANDTDGTLGGLVELGEADALAGVLSRALNRARVCTSDPLCAEHQPHTDGSVHAAACHACTFLAETSCERGNKYLDRALVVPTIAHRAEVALFAR